MNKAIFLVLFAVSFSVLLGSNQDAHASSGTISDGPSCLAIESTATWDGVDTCNLGRDSSMGVGDTLTINPGIILYNSDAFKIKVRGGILNNLGTIDNDGGIIVDEDGIINNPGTINNYGTIFVNTDGTINNGGNTINNFGRITNNGIINNICGAKTTGNEIEGNQPNEVCTAVGGTSIPIDKTALLLAGTQTNAVWIMSTLAVIGSIAFGALYITSKKN